MSVYKSQLCSTHSHCKILHHRGSNFISGECLALYSPSGLPSCLAQCNGKLRILVKAQPCTPSTWPLSPTRLGIQPRDLGLSNEYTLGHCDLSAASRHKLASTSRHHSLFTATWHDSTLLNSFFCFFFIFIFIFFLDNRTPSGKKTVSGVQVITASKDWS